MVIWAVVDPSSTKKDHLGWQMEEEMSTSDKEDGAQIECFPPALILFSME